MNRLRAIPIVGSFTLPPPGSVARRHSPKGEHQIVDGKGNLVIDTGTNPPVVRVDDPTDRLLATATIVVESNGTLIPGAFHTGTLPGTPPTPGTQIQYRFEKTGRYLVVCMNRNHYLNDWMFGFIDVVDAGGTNP